MTKTKYAKLTLFISYEGKDATEPAITDVLQYLVEQAEHSGLMTSLHLDLEVTESTYEIEVGDQNLALSPQ